MSTSKKRAYNSKTRLEKSENTKSRILDASRQLFESNGFDQVKIEDIAKKAEVSVPTVYAIFQSKKKILLTLMDSALSMEKFEALVDLGKKEPCPQKRLQITARLARQLYEAERSQLGFLRGASILDPVFKELELEQERRRYHRQKETVETMAKEEAFGKKFNLPKLRDIMWAFTGRDFYRMLVVERGWSGEEYEAWLGNLLIQSLLFRNK